MTTGIEAGNRSRLSSAAIRDFPKSRMRMWVEIHISPQLSGRRQVRIEPTGVIDQTDLVVVAAVSPDIGHRRSHWDVAAQGGARVRRPQAGQAIYELANTGAGGDCCALGVTRQLGPRIVRNRGEIVHVAAKGAG